MPVSKHVSRYLLPDKVAATKRLQRLLALFAQTQAAGSDVCNKAPAGEKERSEEGGRKRGEVSQFPRVIKYNAESSCSRTDNETANESVIHCLRFLRPPALAHGGH